MWRSIFVQRHRVEVSFVKLMQHNNSFADLALFSADLERSLDARMPIFERD